LFNDVPFSGFAIETFRDGSLATQMSLMRGLQDGFTPAMAFQRTTEIRTDLPEREAPRPAPECRLFSLRRSTV